MSFGLAFLVQSGRLPSPGHGRACHHLLQVDIMLRCCAAGPQGLVIGPHDGLLYVTIRSFRGYPVRLCGHKACRLCPELATDTSHSFGVHMASCKIWKLEQVICAIDKSLVNVHSACPMQPRFCARLSFAGIPKLHDTSQHQSYLDANTLHACPLIVPCISADTSGSLQNYDPAFGAILRFDISTLPGTFKNIFASTVGATDCSQFLHRPEGLVWGPSKGLYKENLLYVTGYTASAGTFKLPAGVVNNAVGCASPLNCFLMCKSGSVHTS